MLYHQKFESIIPLFALYARLRCVCANQNARLDELKTKNRKMQTLGFDQPPRPRPSRSVLGWLFELG
jgi:hypothetical protein